MTVTTGEPADVQAWGLVADAIDRALALDLSDRARGLMLRCRALLAALARRPIVRTARVPEPAPDNVVQLRRGEA